MSVCVGGAILLTIGFAHPAGATTVMLRDGSAISGEVVALKDGVYTIRSRSLGTLAIKQSDVRTLTEDSAVRPRTGDAAGRSASELEALQAQMAADPGTVNAINTLQDDPAVAAVLHDPDVLRALQDGNLEALLSNPNIARLAADPRVQDITKKLAH